jgi:uncharacterized membrane protein (DUF2068 family)
VRSARGADALVRYLSISDRRQSHNERIRRRCEIEQDMLVLLLEGGRPLMKPGPAGRAKQNAGTIGTEKSRALTLKANRDHSRWLVLIGVLKLFKGLLFILLGLGALHLLHKDLVDALMNVVVALRFDPENHFVNLVLEKVALINPHRLRQISIAIFCYAALDLIEGTGLALEKTWAEYLTLILTASFLPWEIFEIIRHITWWKVVLLLLNALVLVYLVFDVQGRIRLRAEAEANSAAGEA